MSLKYRDCGIELEPTQELYGIGLANLTSCLFNGFPVTGGFARTPLNGSAGARTPLASFVTAFLLLFVVLALTSLFEKLPQATLAATICVAVTGLLDFHTPKLLWQVRPCGRLCAPLRQAVRAAHTWRGATSLISRAAACGVLCRHSQVSRPDLLVLGTAFFATLILGIEEGVLVACVLSLAIVIKQTTSPHWALLGRLVRLPYPRGAAAGQSGEPELSFLRLWLWVFLLPAPRASRTPPCGTISPGFRTPSPCGASPSSSSTRGCTLPTPPCSRCALLLHHATVPSD